MALILYVKRGGGGGRNIKCYPAVHRDLW
jgi:hypothetical protein